ncbi:C40 family peptidase [Streptomyces sp. NPDC002588]|uniref:C40 family peptidase n=1 Tax=Streptomyces sp. NPDC002588 TaxID=3154419 RepID=UPI00331A1EB5
MSHTAHIRSHKKPRRSASTIAMRAGVAGGVLSTLAVAGASASANAAEPVTQTLELPILTSDLAGQVAQSAEATQQAAANYELQAERDAAAAKAAKQAKADLTEAKKAEAKKKADAARKAAAEQATSRSAERSTLAASSSSSSSTSTSTATGSAAAIIAFARAQIGDAYVLGATGPNSWDCSSLMQAAFKQAGISLPRVSQDQSTVGTPVSLSNLQPGDILYWGSAGNAYHTALYVGDGKFVGAENPSTGIVEKPLSWDPPTGAVRVL